VSAPIVIPLSIEPSAELLGAIAELRQLCERAEAAADRVERLDAEFVAKVAAFHDGIKAERAAAKQEQPIVDGGTL
jgi:cytochrome c553